MSPLNLADANWRKSSRSGNGDCVEIAALELTSAAWRKSTRSAYNGNCVELAGLTRAVGVRDSKNPEQPVLLVAPTAWNAFGSGLRAGRFATPTG